MDGAILKDTGTPVVIGLEGHIDSASAPSVEKQILEYLNGYEAEELVLDAENLQYISSAGLRIILRLRKKHPALRMINVSTEVYEILDMTGFTEMLEVCKAYRRIAVEGCEVIGQGANGKVYRLSADTVVKVYRNPDSLPDIQRERELARKAFVLGIPTAIPYDVVRVGESYGSVFELLNAKSLLQLMRSGEKSIDETVDMSIGLLKQIHETEVKPGSIPDMLVTVRKWVSELAGQLPDDLYGKLTELVDAVPVNYHMLHGDYHLKNIMMQDGEILLIDMDTLCCGHPVFELAAMHNAYRGFSVADHDNVRRFLGIDYETAGLFWRKSLEMYLGTTDEDRIREVEEKAALIGFMRLLRRAIRRNRADLPGGMEFEEACRKKLTELLGKVDTLLF